MERTEVNRIVEQLERLYSKNWPDVDLHQLLDAITETKANSTLPGFNNTIHQIVQHLIADTLVVTKRLEGIDYQLQPDEDWISADKLKVHNWIETQKRLVESKDVLIKKMENLKDADIDNPIIKDYSTVYVTLHGYIQHSYYHIGQISVIYRALAN